MGQKLLQFLQGYDSFLQKFPTLYKVFRIFSIGKYQLNTLFNSLISFCTLLPLIQVLFNLLFFLFNLTGTKDLYSDVLEYMKVSKGLALGNDVKKLTYKELMNHYEVPKALSKVLPTLFISALPFANYVVFPLAYKYPRTFLSTHYWSLEQRVDFALDDHKKRLLYYKPVFRHLQNNLKLIADEQIREKLQSIFYTIGSGMHPQLEHVLVVNSVFRGNPYGLHYLSSGHLVSIFFF